MLRKSGIRERLLTPLPFSIFLSAVCKAGVSMSGGGVDWLTRIDGALEHREALNKYGSLHFVRPEVLAYADDAALT